MLAARRPPEMAMPQQAIPRTFMWGTQKPPTLKFGGKEYAPDHPFYNLIQSLILQQYGGRQAPMMGNQG